MFSGCSLDAIMTTADELKKIDPQSPFNFTDPLHHVRGPGADSRCVGPSPNEERRIPIGAGIKTSGGSFPGSPGIG